MSECRKILTDLAWVADRWADLEESRIRGTARPWREPTDEMPPERRAERDRLARIERKEADDRMPGYSLAPLHVDVLDTMSDILMAADLLHEHVAQTVGHPRLDPAACAYADPRPYIAYVTELLPEACDMDPDMASAARERVTTMRESIAAHLGEITEGQRLKAVCPFCIGVTSHHPAGGGQTLRFRLIPDSLAEQDPAGEIVTQPVIVCEGGLCTPFASEVSLWVKGQPAWRWHDWEWLATRLLPCDGAA